jgi:uncharacterized protein (TIGR02611 family)
MSISYKWRARFSKLGFKQVRRVVVFVVGMTVLLLGIALLVLPGPAILVIPAGLAILGLEFRWARRWMRRARAVIRSGETRFFRRGGSQGVGDGGEEGIGRQRVPHERRDCPRDGEVELVKETEPMVR